jgi:hypothetical protein
LTSRGCEDEDSRLPVAKRCIFVNTHQSSGGAYWFLYTKYGGCSFLTPVHNAVLPEDKVFTKIAINEPILCIVKIKETIM